MSNPRSKSEVIECLDALQRNIARFKSDLREDVRSIIKEELNNFIGRDLEEIRRQLVWRIWIGIDEYDYTFCLKPLSEPQDILYYHG